MTRRRTAGPRRRNPWLALESGADPVERARELREEHPLARMMPALRHLLLDAAEAPRHLVAVCAPDGGLLWVEDPSRVRMAAADTMHFAEGTLWSEGGAGTNALGTTLGVGHPIQVFSAEHHNTTVHPWTCSAAPVFDPESGCLLGSIDLPPDGALGILSDGGSFTAEPIGVDGGFLVWAASESAPPPVPPGASAAAPAPAAAGRGGGLVRRRAGPSQPAPRRDPRPCGRPSGRPLGRGALGGARPGDLIHLGAKRGVAAAPAARDIAWPRGPTAWRATSTPTRSSCRATCATAGSMTRSPWRATACCPARARRGGAAARRARPRPRRGRRPRHAGRRLQPLCKV